MIDLGHPDRGYLYSRVHFDPLEAALASDWEEINVRRPGVNHGMSTLQALFCRDNDFGEAVTRRDRYVSATVVQWLGTNCGFAFLTSALAKAGYAIHVQEGYFERKRRAIDESLVEAIALAECEQQAWQLIFDLSEPN